MRSPVAVGNSDLEVIGFREVFCRFSRGEALDDLIQLLLLLPHPRLTRLPVLLVECH
jgi:hypothetical protein